MVEPSPYSRSSLIAQGAKSPSSFLFFYGHDTAKGPQAMLSNFWTCPQPFTDSENRQYATSEHYMMHRKALLFHDAEAAAILNASTPQKAKALGRKVRNFDERTWQQHRLQIVVDGCTFKFAQCQQARQFLLSSGDRILAEASPRDRIWGIGMSASNADRCDPSKWRGLNLLGEALMIVRGRLREHTEHQTNAIN